MIGAGLLTAQFVGARAARDAFYLTRLDVATLPQIVIATAVCSITLVALSSYAFRRLSPAVLVPLAFGISALLFLIEWALMSRAPVTVARVLYLHVSGLGPMLGSGFWLIATERFDPRSAKRYFGRITGAGTLGGLIGAVLTERAAQLIGLPSVLLILALLNAACAWQMRQLARPIEAPGCRALDASPELSAQPARLGLHALASITYLRHLAALVFLGTTGAALLDYAFKVEAVGAFGRGDGLLRFFAIYYSLIGLITFVVQVGASRLVLEKLGLATATSTPSLAMLFGGAGALLLPGLPAAVAARGGESVLRGSLFRAGYEIFYSPVSAAERRAAKSIIDVGFDRLGDAAGGGVVRLAQMLSTPQQLAPILSVAIGCAMVSLVVAGRLRRGYVQTLERSLVNRAVELDLSEIEDVTTRTALFRTLGPGTSALPSISRQPESAAAASKPARIAEGVADRDVQRIMDLRSRDAARVLPILREEGAISAALVPHVLPLLAWDTVADEAVNALRSVAEERVGALTDALLDPNQPFAIRRRLARVFSICVSQRAADALLSGLDDPRFEVRFQCGRSLSAILERNALVRIDPARAIDAARREVSVSRPVWESRQLLDGVDDSQQRSLVDDFVDVRANQSLAHVFTLLTLTLPAEPLRIAFRGLQTTDPHLRGTALEYLELVLPPDIRDRLWPFLDAPRTPAGQGRPREQVIADLQRSNPSIMLHLEELRRLTRERPLEKR